MALAAGLMAAATTATPAGATTTLGAGVTQEVVFSDPTTNTTTWADRTVHTRMIQLIDATPTGATIHGTIWNINIKAFTDALLRAKARGVEVNLVLGGQVSVSSGEGLRLKNAFGSRLKRCDTHTSTGSHIHACISNRSTSTMHAKYFLFTQTKTRPDATTLSKNVVAVTSTNPTTSQYYHYNDLVITAGDRTSYDGYLKHFQDMAAMRKNNNYADSTNGKFTAPAALSETVFFPKASSTGSTTEEASTDIVAQRLKLLTAGPGCAVRASQRFFQSSRDPVRNELIRLRKGGCAVEVLYSSLSTSTRDALVAAGVSLRKVNAYHSSVGTETKVHHKYFIVEGTYAGVANSSLVFTGSHNWTGAALRTNDELMLRLTHKPVVDAYKADFAKIWKRWA